MPRSIVLDASAALSVLRDEPSASRVITVLRDHIDSGGQVFVPSHFWLELANVLVRRYGHTANEVIERVRVLDEFELQSVDLDRTLWLLGVQRAADRTLSAYDAVYLAAAEVLEADLLTLDAQLAAAAGARAIRLGPHRLGEVSAPYGNSATVAAPAYADGASPNEVLGKFGEYVAELRRQALAG